MHGRRTFRLSAAERTALAEYLRRGGFSVADSICASEAFSEAFRREIQAALPDHPLQPIPPDHPLLSTEFQGYDLSTVQLRNPSRRVDQRRSAANANRTDGPGPGGHPNRRSPGGGVLALRPELRVGKPSLDRVQRLRPRGRCQDRHQRAAVRHAELSAVPPGLACDAPLHCGSAESGLRPGK